MVSLVEPTHAAAATRRYALIVANAQDLQGKADALEYADDDGARYYELFSHIADEVALHAVLDRPSQRLYPEVTRVARPPRYRDVLAGLERIYARAEADLGAGHEVVFYFVLVGHGDVGAGGEGYVSLLDAPFTRTDLFQKVLARSPATTNHIIVDACHSYFMVHRRGGSADDAGPSRRQAVQSFLAGEDLGRYPNTGVLLSTSAARESHEWSAYGAGVFSHEVRSALAGGADVNADGRIEYSEVAAFIAAANAAVANPRARVDLYARAPAIELGRPVVDLSQARFANWLRLERGNQMRVYLEDSRGVRYVDVHTSGETDVVLGLVKSPFYYVRRSDDRREARIELSGKGRVDVSAHALRPTRVAARGAVAEAFRRSLFAEPYGPSFYRGFVASSDSVPVAERLAPAWMPAPSIMAMHEPPMARPAGKTRRVAAWTLGATAAALALGGTYALLDARAQERAFLASHVDGGGNIIGISPADARAAEERARLWSLVGGVLLAGAGVSGVGATILFVTDSRAEPQPAGITIGGTF